MRGIVWTAVCLAAGLTVALPAQAGERFIGEVFAVPMSWCPDESLPADGRSLPVDQHHALYSLLENRYGGDGMRTFHLPKVAAADFGGKPATWCIVDTGDYPMRPEHH